MSLTSLLSTSPKRLLIAAALLHVFVVSGIAIAGKTQILPGTFDRNGTGISFALDAMTYRIEALAMADLLAQGRFREWYDFEAYMAPLHVRLYSLSFVVFRKVLGEGVLGVEPLNLFYYLSILIVTYWLGATALSAEAGRLAAIIVGLWPSFLLMSTQLLKDHLFILSFLVLMLAIVACIQKSLSYRGAVGFVLAGILAMLTIVRARSSMWEIVLLALSAGALLCVVGQFIHRRFELPKTIAILAMLVAGFVLPKAMQTGRIGDRIRYSAAGGVVQRTEIPRSLGLAGQIGWARNRFIAAYPNAGSNIDTDVRLSSTMDLIRYLPRAAEIGLLAPFPRMWFARGAQVGLSGRLLSGAEMLVIYALLMLACLTVVNERKGLSVWFLFVIAVASCVALAYVVVNVSALYRMRYGYFILIIILAAQALQRWNRSAATVLTR